MEGWIAGIVIGGAALLALASMAGTLMHINRSLELLASEVDGGAPFSDDEDEEAARRQPCTCGPGEGCADDGCAGGLDAACEEETRG